MKKLVLSVFAAALISSTAFSADLSNEKQKTGYAIGLNFAMMLSQQLGPVKSHMDMDAFLAGLKDGLNGQKPQLAMDEIKNALQKLQEVMQAEQAKAMQENADKGKVNAEKGKAFLDSNKTQAGVKTTASGLQYKVIKEGTGKKPTAKDTVKVNYEGKLIDGTVFDSSYKRGEPISFPLNGVIPGWTEGLQLMTEGSTYEFAIPADLAYGKNAPPSIGPNSTLIFKVELIKVNPEEEKK